MYIWDWSQFGKKWERDVLDDDSLLVKMGLKFKSVEHKNANEKTTNRALEWIMPQLDSRGKRI